MSNGWWRNDRRSNYRRRSLVRRHRLGFRWEKLLQPVDADRQVANLLNQLIKFLLRNFQAPPQKTPGLIIRETAGLFTFFFRGLPR